MSVVVSVLCFVDVPPRWTHRHTNYTHISDIQTLIHSLFLNADRSEFKFSLGGNLLDLGVDTMPSETLESRFLRFSDVLWQANGGVS